MPPEPALETFIKQNNLAVVNADPRMSVASQSAVRVGGDATQLETMCLV